MAQPVKGVVYSISVDGGYIAGNGLVRDVEFRQGWGKHDLAFVRVEYPRPYNQMYRVFTLPEGAAVHLIWGRRPHNIRDFYGYVNHHEISSESASGNNAVEITYVLIGTGRPLNSDRSRAWQNLSYSYVAQRIAREHNLRAIVHRCPNTAVYEVQSGESDFSFLSRLAEKAGYNFRVSGGNLYFVNPNTLVKSRTVVDVPTFSIEKELTQLDTAAYFRLLAGENLPGRVKAHREIYGLDAAGNLIQATAGSGRINKIDNTEVVSSYGEAKRIITGLDLYEQNWVTAEAQVLGDVRIEPGKLIYLQGGALPDQSAGYWMVDEAKHHVESTWVDPSKDVFTTKVKLSRNSKTNVIIKDEQLIGTRDIPCYLGSDGNWQASIVTAVIGDNL